MFAVVSSLACRCILVALVHCRAKSDVREALDENRFELSPGRWVPYSCPTRRMGILELYSDYRQTTVLDMVSQYVVKILRSKEGDKVRNRSA